MSANLVGDWEDVADWDGLDVNLAGGTFEGLFMREAAPSVGRLIKRSDNIPEGPGRLERD